MSNFTKEKINKYASDLLIGLSDEERDMIQSEFDEIEKNMELINNIPNIKETDIMSYPCDMEVSELRSDDDVGQHLDIKDLLSNCDKVEGREVEVPKVVG